MNVPAQETGSNTRDVYSHFFLRVTSLFQALGQWGRSKKRSRDERGLVKVNDPTRRPVAFFR